MSEVDERADDGGDQEQGAHVLGGGLTGVATQCVHAPTTLP